VQYFTIIQAFLGHNFPLKHHLYGSGLTNNHHDPLQSPVRFAAGASSPPFRFASQIFDLRKPKTKHYQKLST